MSVILPVVKKKTLLFDTHLYNKITFCLFVSIALHNPQTLIRGCSHGIMVKAMDCGIVGREFVLQSRYYVHFRVNTLGKGMNPLILPAMG